MGVGEGTRWALAWWDDAARGHPHHPPSARVDGGGLSALPSRPVRHHALLVCALSTLACTSATPPPDAAVDASDALDRPDATEVSAPVDVAAPLDRPPSRCEGALPAWAARTDATLIARCAQLDLHATALADGTLRLQYLPTGVTPLAPRPWAVLAQTPFTAATAGGDLTHATLCGDGITLTVARDTCRVQVRDAAGRTLLDDGDAGAWRRADDGSVSLERPTPLDERFYGTGERHGALSRRGTRAVFYNTDGYESRYGGVAPDADPLYASMPVYLGVRGGVAYGVFTDNTHRIELDLARATPDRITLRAAGGTIDQYVVAGPAMADVLRRYTALTGRTPTPPRWALGYHQCRWGYANAARLEAVAAEFRARSIPMDAVWLDIQHMEGFRTFTWDARNFADPAAMIARLRGRDVQTVVIADPGLKVDPAWSVYREVIADGHALRTTAGAPYTGAVWPGAAVFPDVTRAATRRWWGDQIAGIARLGVAGIWLDVNEPTVFPESGGGSVPDALPVEGDGRPTTMAEAHNVYGLLEARATREGLLRARPDARPFVLTRAGYAGSQREAALWTGDAPSTWTSLRQQLPTLLNLGLSGMAFVGSDVGGYSGRATPELFARWMALGSVSPFFRGHVTQGVPDQEPWAFGTEVEDISRALLEARMRRMPYLEALFDVSSRSGAPILRPLAYEFDDDASAAVDDEAMLGPWILVAPVLSQGATSRRVHLPPGRWFEEQSGAVWEGPADVELPVTLAALPTFVREGAILPYGPVQQHAGRWSDRVPLALDIYPAARATSFTVLDDLPDGAPDAPRGRVTFEAMREADGMTLAARVEGPTERLPATIELRVRRVDARPASVTLGGRAWPELDEAAWSASAMPGWRWDDNDRALRLRGVTLAAMPLRARYDTALRAPRPEVEVRFDVTVPDGTSRAAPIFLATSANGWTHAPMSWDAATGHAVGVARVPRGQWFFYKFTRGGWDTVERYPDCSEANNRYGLGAAGAPRRERVWTWRDRCL